MSKPVARVFDPTLIAVGHLVRLLTDGKLTARQLAEETGLTYLTVNRYLRALYHAKAIYIDRYEPDARGAFTIRIYKIGREPDAIAPARTRAQRAREQRKRARYQRPLATTYTQTV